MEGDAFKVLLEAISGLDLANYKEAKNGKKGSLVAKWLFFSSGKQFSFFFWLEARGRMKEKHCLSQQAKLSCSHCGVATIAHFFLRFIAGSHEPTAGLNNETCESVDIIFISFYFYFPSFAIQKSKLILLHLCHIAMSMFLPFFHFDLFFSFLFDFFTQ